MAGLGVVIRNGGGQVLVSLSEQIIKPPTVEILSYLLPTVLSLLLQSRAMCRWFVKVISNL